MKDKSKNKDFKELPISCCKPSECSCGKYTPKNKSEDEDSYKNDSKKVLD